MAAFKTFNGSTEIIASPSLATKESLATFNDDGEIDQELNYQQNRQRKNKLSLNCFLQNADKSQTNMNSSEHSSYSAQSLSYVEDESADQLFDVTASTDDYLENAVAGKASTSHSRAKWMRRANIVEEQKMVGGHLVVPKCAVCSDSASGTRYGVCVCEGCKEFFRRQRENSGNRQLHCVNGTNECEVNLNNRTQCRKCRLDKCIKLGMKLAGK